MSTRISSARFRFLRGGMPPVRARCWSAALALSVTACHVPIPDKAEQARKAAAAEAMANAEGHVPCASRGAAEFRRVCTIDRTQTQDGLFLTLRHPDGGFRRLLVTGDGRGVVAADGAETALVTPLGPNEIEVALGDARYRLPATVKPAALP